MSDVSTATGDPGTRRFQSAGVPAGAMGFGSYVAGREVPTVRAPPSAADPAPPPAVGPPAPAAPPRSRVRSRGTPLLATTSSFSEGRSTPLDSPRVAGRRSASRSRTSRSGAASLAAGASEGPPTAEARDRPRDGAGAPEAPPPRLAPPPLALGAADACGGDAISSRLTNRPPVTGRGSSAAVFGREKSATAGVNPDTTMPAPAAPLRRAANSSRWR